MLLKKFRVIFQLLESSTAIVTEEVMAQLEIVRGLYFYRPTFATSVVRGASLPENLSPNFGTG